MSDLPPETLLEMQRRMLRIRHFERRVSAYQVAVAGEVSFSEAF